MTYEQFWEHDRKLVVAYRKADELRRHRRNEELWIEGMYTAEALASTVGNMFSKTSKHKYPTEPYPITAEEAKERKERARKAKEEQFKAAFMSRALSINARMGGQSK